jgi:DNA (cytosine-5)-methyltransferase 1
MSKPSRKSSRRSSKSCELDSSLPMAQLRLWEPCVKVEVKRQGAAVVRTVTAGRFSGRSSIPASRLPKALARKSLDKAWLLAELRGVQPKPLASPTSKFRIVDLFCGAGGFSVGIRAALTAVGLAPEFVAAVDLDQVALNVYRKNMPRALCLNTNVDGLVDYAITNAAQRWQFKYEPVMLHPSFRGRTNRIDMVVGGPPCQGHSNLNNVTRRNDPRNSLYLTVPAIGVALGARVILVENVPSVTLDKTQVVQKARDCLEAAGYFVDDAVLEGARLGVPQRRKRHFLMATKQKGSVSLARVHEALSMPAVTLWDAIGDLARCVSSEILFDSPAILSPENRMRVDHLFDKDLYELPNAVRPECHREGHTYPSVYGRMYPDKPAQTLTCGFMSPGRGRFVHPTQRRGITPHEGARIQGFPDSFPFEQIGGAPLHRKDLGKTIGDAVPPPMSFAATLAALSSL